jgi:hypothetical protein
MIAPTETTLLKQTNKKISSETSSDEEKQKHNTRCVGHHNT